MSAAEIKEYFGDFTTKYNLLPDCRVSTTVTKVESNEGDEFWQVPLQAGEVNKTGHYEMFNNCSGLLSFYKLECPEVDGLQDFTRTRLHSAACPGDAARPHKRACVLIGNGFVATFAAISSHER